VDCIRHAFPVSNTVAPKLISDDTSRFITTHLQQALKETIRCLSISAALQEHVNHFPILVDCTPEIVLFALDLHEYLIEIEGIAVSLMPAPKSPGVLRAKLNAPQSDRLIADLDTALSHEILDIAVA